MLARGCRPAGWIEPCQPTTALKPPSGPGWIHEIKHDGFRLFAQRSGDRVRLNTRNGHNWTTRYPLIARAVELLVLRSCLIDGEAIACNGNGLADFELLRGRHLEGEVVLCAFDLLELDGQDLRREAARDAEGDAREPTAQEPPGPSSERTLRAPR